MKRVRMSRTSLCASLCSMYAVCWLLCAWWISQSYPILNTTSLSSVMHTSSYTSATTNMQRTVWREHTLILSLTSIAQLQILFLLLLHKKALRFPSILVLLTWRTGLVLYKPWMTKILWNVKGMYTLWHNAWILFCIFLDDLFVSEASGTFCLCFLLPWYIAGSHSTSWLFVAPVAF